MTTQHWLEGLNVPPYLEALPPPQPTPRVRWNHSPSATPSVAHSVANPPQPGHAEAKALPTSLSSNSSARSAPVEQRDCERHDATSLTEGSASPGDDSGGDPGSGESCRGPAGEEGDAFQAAEKTALSGQNWRGGGPKIKVRRACGYSPAIITSVYSRPAVQLR